MQIWYSSPLCQFDTEHLCRYDSRGDLLCFGPGEDNLPWPSTILPLIQLFIVGPSSVGCLKEMDGVAHLCTAAAAAAAAAVETWSADHPRAPFSLFLPHCRTLELFTTCVPTIHMMCTARSSRSPVPAVSNVTPVRILVEARILIGKQRIANRMLRAASHSCLWVQKFWSEAGELRAESCFTSKIGC